MIDTLSRHLAALTEARRLLAMVLANNPQFVEVQRAMKGASALPETSVNALATDPYYQAHQHITAALDALRPAAEQVTVQPSAGRLSEAIVALKPCQPALKRAGRAPTHLVLGSPRPCETSPKTALSCLDRTEKGPLPAASSVLPSPLPTPPTLEARIRYVLEVPATPPPEIILPRLAAGSGVMRENCVQSVMRDEAKVAIVRYEQLKVATRDAAPPLTAAMFEAPQAGV